MNFMQITQMMNSPQVKAIMNSPNPQQALINMIKSSPNFNNEVGNNIVNMIQSGDTQGLNSYAMNLAKSQGITQEQLNMIKNMTGKR